MRAAANTAAGRGGISCLEGDPHQIKETSQRSPLRSPLGRSLLTGNQQGGSRLCDDASSADLEEIDECAVSVCLPVRLSACPPACSSARSHGVTTNHDFSDARGNGTRRSWSLLKKPSRPNEVDPDPRPSSICQTTLTQAVSFGSREGEARAVQSGAER